MDLSLNSFLVCVRWVFLLFLPPLECFKTKVLTIYVPRSIAIEGSTVFGADNESKQLSIK